MRYSMFSMFRQRCVTNRLWETKMPRSRNPVRSGISNPALWCFRFRAQNLANHLCPPPTKHREKMTKEKKEKSDRHVRSPPELMLTKRSSVLLQVRPYELTPPISTPPSLAPLLLILLLPRRSQSVSQQPSCWRS